ncbi:hypothetical protein [Gaetbulibacter jejuensis]|uniref:hypothetical protein n=1 Tax=Gaetbulibacter jejuensis TaxID=584607 RepID=UPI00300A227F
MATPVFKFQHPDLPGENLYFIYNTFYDEPSTIPMDLITFLKFHFATGRTIEGFLLCWKDIQATGTSLSVQTFESFFNTDQKESLYETASCSYALDTASKISNVSKELFEVINENPLQINPFELEERLDGLTMHYLLRPLEYYESRAALMDFLYEINDSNEGTDWLSVLLENEEAYLRQLDNIPLHLVPHKYRNNGYFYEQCLQQKQFAMIPSLPDKDRNFALNALTQNVFAAPYINKAFLEDSEFILEVAQHQPSIVTYVNQEIIDTNQQLKAIQGQNIDDDLPF